MRNDSTVDLSSHVKSQEGETLSNKTGSFAYAEVSSKTGEGIQEFLNMVVVAATLDKKPDKTRKKCIVI